MNEEKESIGVIWMEEDGSIAGHVYVGEGLLLGDVNLFFDPDHPDYQRVLAHVGGLEPDEAKKLYDWDFALSL